MANRSYCCVIIHTQADEPESCDEVGKYLPCGQSEHLSCPVRHVVLLVKYCPWEQRVFFPQLHVPSLFLHDNCLRLWTTSVTGFLPKSCLVIKFLSATSFLTVKIRLVGLVFSGFAAVKRRNRIQSTLTLITVFV